MTEGRVLRLEQDGEGWQLAGTGAGGFGLVNDYLGYLADRNYSPRTGRAYGFDLRAFRNLSSQLRQLRSVHLGFDLGLVDPELGRHRRRVWSATEALRVGVVGGGEGVLAVLIDGVGGVEVDRGRGVPRDA